MDHILELRRILNRGKATRLELAATAVLETLDIVMIPLKQFFGCIQTDRELEEAWSPAPARGGVQFNSWTGKVQYLIAP